MILRLENYTLGETDEALAIGTSEDVAEVSLAMARQARRTLDIVSRKLDPVVFDTPEFVEAVRQLVLRSRHSKVRLLVHEPAQIMKRGHRLIDLGMQLTTFIELRVPDKEHADFNESLFIAEGIGYIHRQNGERYEAKLNFHDGRMARILTKVFDEMWDKSRPDPNLRRALL